jgi:hypothetical protein
MNYPKQLLEKYSLVKENDKEDILAGLDAVGKDLEILNLFKYHSGLPTSTDKPLNYFIDKVEDEVMHQFFWDHAIPRREAQRLLDTMPIDERHELIIAKIAKWFEEDPETKNEICPNITLEDIENLLFLPYKKRGALSFPNAPLNEDEKDDILAGLSDIEGQSRREDEFFKNSVNIVNGFNRIYEGNTQEEYNFVRNALRVGLGMDDDEIKKINIIEIVLNSNDVGEEIENSIQGWEDPNFIFSPGEVLLYKLKQIKQDRDEGILHQQYYYYNPIAEYWTWEQDL